MSDNLAARAQPADDHFETTRISYTATLRATDPASLVDASQAPSGRTCSQAARAISFGPPSHGSPSGSGTAPARVIGETLPGGAAVSDVTVRQVGRYLIRGSIGRGGMATVFQAHDPALGREVAIKFLHPTFCADDDYRARFLQEARAAGGLAHPNIVTVHDVGEIEGRPYMAMELLTGQPLGNSTSGAKALSVRETVLIGIQLAKALGHAHAHGIVHRDIKPGNIVLQRSDLTIKVTDFGIAHVESNDDGRTQIGDVLGTPQYMSPEQTQGCRLDGRSDLFSAGIVLYQLLTGKRPFQGETLVAVAVQIATEAPAPIRELRPEVPPSLRRVIDRCLAKAPEQRWQTGEELAQALVKVLSEMDAAALAKQTPRLASVRVRWAGTMALIVALVMVAAGALITQRQQAAMLGQMSDNGAALARFIAMQNAADTGLEDWGAVEVAVASVMRTGDIAGLTIADRAGVVRAASDATLIGKPFRELPGESIGRTRSGLPLTRHTIDEEESVLGLATPITFSGTPVGRLWLALPEKPLREVARLSIGLMIALLLVTVAAVAIAVYVVSSRFARPLRLVGESMDEIASGRFDHRIGEVRSDEFGRLYAAFDRMAEALQKSVAAGEATPPAGPRGLGQR